MKGKMLIAITKGGAGINHLRWQAAFVLLVVLPFIFAGSHQAQAEQEVVFLGGAIIDGNGGAPIQDGAVVIRGGRIVQVGKRSAVRYSKAAKIIDTSGKDMLPGLIDIHVHYNDWMGEMFLAHGVTTVKDVGNDVDWVATISSEVEQGKVRGPRIFYVGNGLNTPPPRRDHFIGLTSPEMGKRVVRLLHDRGAVAIKVREHITPELLKGVTE